MAFSTEIEAKSPENVASREIELPSMEPAPAASGAPGFFGLLCRPGFAFKVSVATLVLGAAAVLLTPVAFPPRTVRLPPPLPNRGPARRPPRLASPPLPEWMVARRLPSAVSHGPSAVSPTKARAAPPSPAVAHSKLAAESQKLTAVTLPIRIQERAGTTCVVARSGVTISGSRVPSEWAREARRLFVAPAHETTAPPLKRPALRLLGPDPADAAILSPPTVLRWSSVPGVGRYLLSVEALTDPAEQTWSPVQDLFLLEVTGTDFHVPAAVHWTPGALYRWRVQTGDGQSAATGRFRLLSEKQQDQLRAARRTVAGSRLLQAAVYHSFGLYGAALDELESLRAAQPKSLALRQAVLNVEAEVRRQREGGAG